MNTATQVRRRIPWLPSLCFLTFAALIILQFVTHSRGLIVFNETFQLFLHRSQLHLHESIISDGPGYAYSYSVSFAETKILGEIHNFGTDSAWNFLGFYFYFGRHWLISLPFWFITFLPILPLILSILSKRIRSRIRTSFSHCPICNYDLRATPARCPECGHVLPRPSPES